MTLSTFNAFVVEEDGDSIVGGVKSCGLNDLSEGDMLIKTSFSAFNYKDALATIKNGGVIRSYPMIPGVDAVGEIVESANPKYKKGEKVVVTGNGFGVSHTGGFSEVLRIPSDWAVVLPDTITEKEGAIIGTAGITAVEAINRLEKIGMTKESRVLVTGATGGVGSIALAMLKSLGYDKVSALSRKKNEDYLMSLGAKEVLSLEEFKSEKPKPLQKQTYDFVIDTIGGETVGDILPQISYGGGMALCGNASGIKFTTTILPFILRGVSLVGIDSVQLSNDVKEKIWLRMGKELDKSLIDIIGSYEVSLDAVDKVVTSLLEGSHSGRTLLKF